MKGKSVLDVGVPTENMKTAEKSQNTNQVAEIKVEIRGRANTSMLDWTYYAVVEKIEIPRWIALKKQSKAKIKRPLSAHNT
jgi:hypothetical protein